MIQLDLTLGISPRLSGLFICIHLGAMLCTLLSSIPPWLKAALLAICLCSLLWRLFDHAFHLLPFAVTRLWTDENGAWHLQSKNGKVRITALRGDSVSTPGLIILNFKRGNFRKGNLGTSVLLCKDMLDPASWRRLKIYLNYFNTL